MNRVLVSEAFVDQLAKEQKSKILQQQIHSAVRRLADDPLAHSLPVPFQHYEDVRVFWVGTYRVLFKFYPEKSQIYLFAIQSEADQ
jgi:mRNA-degrading endonuclease RelE of RelBE toxin-antitoxin system